MSFYVYVYRDPDTRSIFYVGKGKDNRAFSHLQKRLNKRSLHNRDFAARIDEILDRKTVPIVEIVKKFDSEEEAISFESQLINEIGLDSLTNKINTSWPPVMPKDVIERRAQTCKNNPSWRATMQSKEHREKLSAAVKKAITERGGRPPLSPAHREAVSRAGKGKQTGIKNPMSKNTPDQVYAFLEAVMKGGGPWKRIAKEMGITNAFNIVHRRAWTSVQPPEGYEPPARKKKS